ncbi:hypothetical protein DID77_03490, partial [Candidatus Marinamargulisbacteria bacterium SCGC AG-439-L15]
ATSSPARTPTLTGTSSVTSSPTNTPTSSDFGRVYVEDAELDYLAFLLLPFLLGVLYHVVKGWRSSAVAPDRGTDIELSEFFNRPRPGGSFENGLYGWVYPRSSDSEFGDTPV